MKYIQSVALLSLFLFAQNAQSASWDNNEFCFSTGPEVLERYGEPTKRIDGWSGEIDELTYSYRKIKKDISGISQNYKDVTFVFGTLNGKDDALYKIAFSYSEQNFPKYELLSLAHTMAANLFGPNYEMFKVAGAPQYTFKPRGAENGSTAIYVTWAEYGHSLSIAYFDCVAKTIF